MELAPFCIPTCSKPLLLSFLSGLLLKEIMLVPTVTLEIVIKVTCSLPDPQTGHVEEHICLICQENLCSKALLLGH